MAKCSANIYFNRQCLKNNIIPKYARVKVPNTSPASQHTAQKAKVMRVKDELKFLHKKKETLNRALYRCDLQTAQEWGTYWNCIHEYILHRVNTDTEKKYKTMDDKIRLIQNTTRKQRTDVSFYPRVVNNTNTEFSEEELNLLNKGLKYNLVKKPKRWINNLAFEAEAAITMLPPSEQDYTRHQVAKNLGRLYQQQKQQNTHNSTEENREEKTVKQIKAKLRKNKAIVSKEDKRNSIVILYSDDYNLKINDFISHGNFTVMDTDITKTVQKGLRDTINE